VTLIPVFGIIGAALATMLGSATLFGAHMVLSQRLYPAPHRWGPMATAALAAVALAVVVPWLSLDGVTRLAASALAVAALVGVVIATGLVRPRDARGALAALRSLLGPGRSRGLD
jgi:O-antigen/teichoic acid export membrane protein